MYMYILHSTFVLFTQYRVKGLIHVYGLSIKIKFKIQTTYRLAVGMCLYWIIVRDHQSHEYHYQ